MSILEDARAVLATGPVCDACLGRVFADRSHGLGNDERGRALRVALAMADDDPVEGDAGADCWVCEGRCTEHDAWAERAVAAVDAAFDTYQVGTRVPPLLEENDALLRADAGRPEDAGEPFKSAFNREVGKRVGGATGAEVDFARPDVLFLLHLEREAVEVQVNPAFVYGRYRKLQREVPQTEWPCRECGGSGAQFDPEEGEADCEHCGGSGYRYETSVEEEIAPHVREAMAGSEAVFHGAGREDVDALMLGTGRPFVAEVKEPGVRRPDLDALAAAIEDSDVVAVSDLALATHEMVERVKELDASKRYRADVALEAPVDAGAFSEAVATLDGATVEQYTPERVDHRRASTTRVREVYAAEGDLLDADGEPLAPNAGDPSDGADLGDEDDPGHGDDHGDDDDPGHGDDPAGVESDRAELRVHTAGGTYVKELVSGDGDRTEPSLASLLEVDAEVTALDVTAVEGEDEAFADPEYLREAEE